MSYILEALRKADAQRERVRVPGLHARPLSAVVEAEPERRWGGPAMAAVLAVGMVLVGLVAWRLAGGGATSTSSPVEAVVAATPAAPAITPAVVNTPAAPPEPATAIVPAAPPPLPHSAEPERPARAARAPAPARQAEPVAATETRDPAPAPAAAPAAVAAAQVPAPMPAASAVPVVAPMLANAAPPGAPQLAVSGGVYSQNPAQRMLIVNGQVFNEGSEVASGVRLEEVRPNKQAVMNFRGQRFTLPY